MTEIIFAAVIGLSLGSFGNVLLHRLPRNKSIMGRSQCPHCHHVLSWQDLIPILSFLLLGGTCRYCKKKISYRYPLVELTTALLFVLLVTRMEHINSATMILTGISVFYLILIALYDLESQRIPDVFTLVLFISALLKQIVIAQATSVSVFQDVFTGALIPLVFFGTQWIISRGRWIGSGDILLGAAIGILLGINLIILALLLAYSAGAVVAIILIVTRHAHPGTRIAFGPFLVLGALLALFAGDMVLQQVEVLAAHSANTPHIYGLIRLPGA